jgi:hypothetical protein
VTVVAAGDIASSPTSAAGTARLVHELRPDAVITLGDNAYSSGTIADYEHNYAPTWGAFRAITHPAPGNHDYRTAGAAGYFDYFRQQVHGRPYYAWNAGTWRMYSLNCEIPCGTGSPELHWLTRDLAHLGSQPVLAYVHEPLFTCSTGHAPATLAHDIWSVLQRANGRILLTGHNHGYERFGPMAADGTAVPGGIREFVVGTGGAEFYPLRSSCPGREASADQVAGVLELRLAATGYRWRFVAVNGKVLDSGTQQFASPTYGEP